MDQEPPPILQEAPPLDPAWLAHERKAGLLAPKPSVDPIARQPRYAAECRERNTAMMAPGARDHRLSQGLTTKYISVPSSSDGFSIPVLQYDASSSVSGLEADGRSGEPRTIIIYYHGGGLTVGEADSEDLSCRRLVKDSAAFLPGVRLYSIGYRLKPQHPASTCVSDSIDAFASLVKTHAKVGGLRIVLVGSSSGGQLAATVAQHALAAGIPLRGVLLRCPVTSDAFRGPEYVPEHLHGMHTSAKHPSFQTSLLARLDMDGPRDGLAKMPLEAGPAELRGMPPTWIQVCSNDVLYSDGACYTRVLRDAGVTVKTNVVWGWPHTFWLKAPHLERALQAELAMVGALRWVADANQWE
ncbi:alpha/beta-hydrolase [Cryphonectria parasitica EP155]|uniref:Alpha/beta-hydrolase n=1 Tax=Cryphonectria parasitica (strain ATCC 38755 / EP155) TaxID=660469 RepID=A0A9P4Y8V3_CRYP1|nr:alpha/beta-hydrolase [Cryphonectria parasitica EP155]KAF3768653.1 alpha/beta-hydrolase [Cryphonectria parasitica EP155]